MTAVRSEDSNTQSSDATIVRLLGRSPNLASVARFGGSLYFTTWLSA
jgi:hypothetical protein